MISFIQNYFYEKIKKREAETKKHLKWEIKAVAEKAIGCQMSMIFVDTDSKDFITLMHSSSAKIIVGDKVYTRLVGFVYMSYSDILCQICEPAIFVDGKHLYDGVPMIEMLSNGARVLAYFCNDQLFVDNDAIEAIIKKIRRKKTNA